MSRRWQKPRDQLIKKTIAWLDRYPSDMDFEKTRWTPGLYDSIAVLLSDNPVIASVQVAPRIAPSEIVIQTRLTFPR